MRSIFILRSASDAQAEREAAMSGARAGGERSYSGAGPPAPTHTYGGGRSTRREYLDWQVTLSVGVAGIRG